MRIWFYIVTCMVLNGCSDLNYVSYLNGRVLYNVEYGHTGFSDKKTYLINDSKIKKVEGFEMDLRDDEESNYSVYFKNRILYSKPVIDSGQFSLGSYKIGGYGTPKKTIQYNPKDTIQNIVVRKMPHREVLANVNYTNPNYYNEKIVFERDGSWNVYYNSTASDSPISFISVRKGSFWISNDTIYAMSFMKTGTLIQYKEYIDRIEPTVILAPKEYVFILKSIDTLELIPKDEFAAPIYYIKIQE